MAAASTRQRQDAKQMPNKHNDMPLVTYNSMTFAALPQHYGVVRKCYMSSVEYPLLYTVDVIFGYAPCGSP